MIHFKVDPTEASLLHTEVCGDLQETRRVALFLDGGLFVTLLVRLRVAPSPAGQYLVLVHFQSGQHTV